LILAQGCVRLNSTFSWFGVGIQHLTTCRNRLSCRLDHWPTSDEARILLHCCWFSGGEVHCKTQTLVDLTTAHLVWYICQFLLLFVLSLDYAVVFFEKSSEVYHSRRSDNESAQVNCPYALLWYCPSFYSLFDSFFSSVRVKSRGTSWQFSFLQPQTWDALSCQS
jgi:hypothetical protein